MEKLALKNFLFGTLAKIDKRLVEIDTTVTGITPPMLRERQTLCGKKEIILEIISICNERNRY